MTKRLPATPAPAPLEAYAAEFDDLFGQRSQREGFRQYLAGLLLPAERNKTLTALANTAPVAGASHPRAQGLQWFLSESTWDPDAVNERRLALLRADPSTAPDARGVLVVDEHGDRKWGKQTAHVGRQYLANLGKTDNGVVSVTSLWADERVYWPVGYAPYTPAHHFADGKADPAFRTKLAIAGELVAAAAGAGIPCRAVVADSFYGEDDGFRQGLRELGLGYVLALKRSHTWWHEAGAVGALWEAALAAGWRDADAPGAWGAVERAPRDLVGAGGRGGAVWPGARAAGGGGDDRPGDAARPQHLVPNDEPARPGQPAGAGAGGAARRRSRRGGAALRAAHVGGAGVQADQARARLVAVPGPRRPGDPSPLATRLLRLLLRLVARRPRQGGHVGHAASPRRPGGGPGENGGHGAPVGVLAPGAAGGARLAGAVGAAAPLVARLGVGATAPRPGATAQRTAARTGA